MWFLLYKPIALHANIISKNKFSQIHILYQSVIIGLLHKGISLSTQEFTSQ